MVRVRVTRVGLGLDGEMVRGLGQGREGGDRRGLVSVVLVVDVWSGVIIIIREQSYIYIGYIGYI